MQEDKLQSESSLHLNRSGWGHEREERDRERSRAGQKGRGGVWTCDEADEYDGDSDSDLGLRREVCVGKADTETHNSCHVRARKWSASSE
eukprot:1161317-Rhodomonas_salina.1